jgi:flavin-dependent dehydrogenase
MDVVVMDKQTFPRDKVCGGWITPGVLAETGIDARAYAATGRVIQPITGFRTSILGRKEAETRYGRVVSYGVLRREFDHYLLERSGARLILGEAFKDIERSGTHWVLNGRIRTPLIVGAGGHFCPVARHFGAQLGRAERVVAAQEVEFEMTPQQQAACRISGEIPELFFLEDLSGYAWCFRKRDVLNIGLGRRDNHSLSQYVDNFVAFLKAHNKIPEDIPTRFRGHAYLLNGESKRQLVENGALLIGDAAGLAFPHSGEGICPAVESGLLAAQAIVNAQGDYSHQGLSTYAKALAARLGARDKSEGRFANLLNAPLTRQVINKLMGVRWFARHVLIDRWFLHSRQVPLEV